LKIAQNGVKNSQGKKGGVFRVRNESDKKPIKKEQKKCPPPKEHPE